MGFQINRGDLFLVDLTPSKGSEQTGVRPVLILQNNIGNYYSPTTIVACLTSHIQTKPLLPTHVYVKAKSGLKTDSIIMLEQIRTIDKRRILSKIGCLNNNEMKKVNHSLKISIGLFSYTDEILI